MNVVLLSLVTFPLTPLAGNVHVCVLKVLINEQEDHSKISGRETDLACVALI